MFNTKIRADSEDAPGAPEWMVTFSDCMTLLLTFFVLLLSFSSFDERVFRNLRLIFSKALPGVKQTGKKDKSAFLHTKQIEHTDELGDGSEKPTLAKGSTDNLKEETEPVDFDSRKVFLIPAKKIFWGKGHLISSEGRDIMATLASFLSEVPARIVISEKEWAGRSDSEHYGLPRAWAVLEYLTTEQGLDKKYFSISASSAAAQKKFRSSEPDRPKGDVERMLEIVLLERSIYN